MNQDKEELFLKGRIVDKNFDTLDLMEYSKVQEMSELNIMLDKLQNTFLVHSPLAHHSSLNISLKVFVGAERSIAAASKKEKREVKKWKKLYLKLQTEEALYEPTLYMVLVNYLDALWDCAAAHFEKEKNLSLFFYLTLLMGQLDGSLSIKNLLDKDMKPYMEDLMASIRKKTPQEYATEVKGRLNRMKGMVQYKSKKEKETEPQPTNKK